MPAALPYTKHPPGRTFLVAVSLLGVVALAQVGALGWAFVQRLKAPPAPTLASAGKAAASPRNALQLPSRELTGSVPFSSPPTAVVAPNPTGPIMPPPKPQPVFQARSEPIPETRLGELMQQGKMLRDRGDNASALIRFREACALDPRNPAAITELALTYERLSLTDKAAEQWKRVFDLGESAGVYFTAAEAKMKQAMMAAQASVQETNVPAVGGTVANAILGLGHIEQENLPDPKGLQRLRLLVPIELRRPGRIVGKDVGIQVIFYDLVDGKPKRTNAKLSNRFATSPADWRDNDAEVLEVEYQQAPPDLSDPTRANRKYFGYIARLYYKDELQASHAEPAQLGQIFPAPQTFEKDAAP